MLAMVHPMTSMNLIIIEPLTKFVVLAIDCKDKKSRSSQSQNKFNTNIMSIVDLSLIQYLGRLKVMCLLKVKQKNSQNGQYSVILSMSYKKSLFGLPDKMSPCSIADLHTE